MLQLGAIASQQPHQGCFLRPPWWFNRECFANLPISKALGRSVDAVQLTPQASGRLLKDVNLILSSAVFLVRLPHRSDSQACLYHAQSQCQATQPQAHVVGHFAAFIERSADFAQYMRI